MHYAAKLALAAAPPLAACAEQAAKAPAAAPAIAAGAQAAGATVVIATATVASGGWFVIHAIEDGKPVIQPVPIN